MDPDFANCIVVFRLNSLIQQPTMDNIGDDVASVIYVWKTKLIATYTGLAQVKHISGVTCCEACYLIEEKK